MKVTADTSRMKANPNRIDLTTLDVMEVSCIGLITAADKHWAIRKSPDGQAPAFLHGGEYWDVFHTLYPEIRATTVIDEGDCIHDGDNIWIVTYSDDAELEEELEAILLDV